MFKLFRKRVELKPFVEEAEAVEESKEPMRLSDMQDIWTKPDFDDWLKKLLKLSNRAQLTFLYRLVNSLNGEVFDKLVEYVNAREENGIAKLNNFSKTKKLAKV